jgi:hypothetical protein
VAAFNLTVSTVIVFVMSQILLPRVKGVKYIVPIGIDMTTPITIHPRRRLSVALATTATSQGLPAARLKLGAAVRTSLSSREARAS